MQSGGLHKRFLADDFLLENDFAVRLYEEYARPMPVIDYHSHLSPKDIALNRRFANITEAWLEGDHYKWRAMRANGVAETFCTGTADPREKFLRWAETVPYTVRNPLYHWTHLELRRYFGVTDLLDADSGPRIYDSCNLMLAQPGYQVQDLLKSMKVEVACTTDDPTDSLEFHEQFAKSNAGFRMLPTFRPDKAYQFHNLSAWNQWTDFLAETTGSEIKGFDDFISALCTRIAYFHDRGCRVSDHGLESIPFHADARSVAPALFEKVRSGSDLAPDEQDMLRAAVLIELGVMYHRQGWVQQFHLGAIRNNSSRAMRSLGPDTGFDSIGDFIQIRSMQRFLNELDTQDKLAKTILYNLNPAYNELFATMAGNFNDGSVPGKMQFGSGWWFLDQKDGMEKQMNALSNMGLISRFVGMVTDSRSFLSFPRHEYFRRILCNLFGRDVARGELPADLNLLGKTVQDICYHNAKAYFGF